jgi:hypothetical protein
MPVIEQTISAAITSFLNGNSSEEDVSKAKKAFADDLAKIIKDAILSATIIVPAGIPVATAGSPSAQTGVTTAPATASIT